MIVITNMESIIYLLQIVLSPQFLFGIDLEGLRKIFKYKTIKVYFACFTFYITLNGFNRFFSFYINR
jgi:hypothetical protein